MYERTPPELIAHRGHARRLPENTLAALQAAVTAGASYVEFDVQLTADEVPVLCHDETLRRTAGIEGRILDLPWSRVRALDAGEAARFGTEFKGTRVPIKTLLDYLEAGDRLTDFLNDFPTVSREQALEVLRLAKEALLSHSNEASSG